MSISRCSAARSSRSWVHRGPGKPRSSTSCPASTSPRDRKSTRLNSSHVSNSYAVFCLKKKRHLFGARDRTRPGHPLLGTGSSDAHRPHQAFVYLSFFFSKHGVRRVLHSFPTRRSSDLVDLEVQRGQVVAIVGPSGAGKTTLVDLLPRFYEPTRSEEHTSELQSRFELVCRLLLEKKKTSVRRSRSHAARPSAARHWQFRRAPSASGLRVSVFLFL